MVEWFKSEIERTKEYLTVEYSTVFNGVDVKSNELRKELLKAHIKFCKAAMINEMAEDEQTAKTRSQIESLKAENKRLEKTVDDMIFLLHNPNGAIYESVKESECKESLVNLEPSDNIKTKPENPVSDCGMIFSKYYTIKGQCYVKDSDYDNILYRLKHKCDEVEKYKKAFEDAKKERDCQVSEISLEKDRLEETISQLDSALYTTFGIRHTDFKNHLEFADALGEKATASMSASNDFPAEPIKVADRLICAARTRENCMTGKEYEKLIYDKDDLRQIARHLLVYCNHAESEE